MKNGKQHKPDFALVLGDLRREFMRTDSIGKKAEETVELDQSRVGRLSRVDALQTQAMSVEMGRRRREQIRKIDAALGRIMSGEYGRCMECGKPIRVARLKADPTATLCIDCASALDSPSAP